MSGSGKSFFKKINRKHPWLKFAILVSVVAVVVMVVMGEMSANRGSLIGVNIIAPMQQHVKVTDRPIRVLRGKKLVALTFDDGPGVNTTPRLLDILYSKGAVATFFELGTNARSNPEIVKRVINEGHELGSHTMYHQNLGNMSAGKIISDVNEAKAVFQGIIGDTPKVMRPPYGAVSDNMTKIIDVPMILWTVDTLDWKSRNRDEIVKQIREGVFDGAIVLIIKRWLNY